MYLRTIGAGLGRTPGEDAVCKAAWFGGFFSPTCWSALTPSMVAPPGAPTGDLLTVPPASGADAQATVDALVNQQLIDQQNLNAQGVQSTVLDQAAGGIVSAGSAVAPSFPWVMLGLLGVGAFALIAVGGGSPRRYGR
jgi:hypothetical protein